MGRLYFFCFSEGNLCLFFWSRQPWNQVRMDVFFSCFPTVLFILSGRDGKKLSSFLFYCCLSIHENLYFCLVWLFWCFNSPSLGITKGNEKKVFNPSSPENRSKKIYTHFRAVKRGRLFMNFVLWIIFNFFFGSRVPWSIFNDVLFACVLHLFQKLEENLLNWELVKRWRG